MAPNKNRVKVIVYIGGTIIQDDWSVAYDCPHKAVFRIRRDISFQQLLSNLYERFEVDNTRFTLNVRGKLFRLYGDRVKEMLCEISCDEHLEMFLDPEEGNDSMDIFVQIVPIYSNMITPQMTFDLNEPHNIVPQLNPEIVAVTQGFSSMGFTNFDVGTSTPAHGNFGNFGETSTIREDVHPNTEEPLGDLTDIPGDYFGPDPPVDSEPSDQEGDDNVDEDHNGDEDDAGVDDIFATLTQNEVPIDVPPMAPAQHQPNLYESIPFYSMSYEEIQADSIGVPTGRFSKFYDKDEGTLETGMIFKSKERLIAAVKDHSIRFARREYKVVESKPTYWKVKCKHNSQRSPCGWRLRGSEKAGKHYWAITKYGGDHTCVMGSMSTNHHNMDMNYISAILVKAVRDDPSCKVSYAQELVYTATGFQISYQKAWYSLRRCRDNIYGTWESSVTKLPKFMKELQRSNPGTVVEWQSKPTNHPNQKVIKYVFWAFKPCLDGFQFSRRVISVDGTHLYTKYKHKLLVATCLDGNQQVLPLGYAIVDEETTSAWTWFFEMLFNHLSLNIGEGKICIISDRAPGLLAAVETLPPYFVHRFCLRHVCSNFNSRFKSIRLKDLCWKAGNEHLTYKFDRALGVIRSQNVEAYNYLMAIDKEKWTLAHDGGWRCGQMTTNISEAINGVLKGARKLPPTAIVDFTFHRAVRMFRERVAKGNVMLHKGQRWCTYADELFREWEGDSVNHVTFMFNRQLQSAEVMTRASTGGGGNNTHTVSIRTRECTCRKWSQVGIPCSHAQHVCRDYCLDASAFVKKFYSVTHYMSTYNGIFRPLLSEDYWEDADFQLFHDSTLRHPTRVGRRRSTRFPNEMDVPQTRAREQARRNG